MNSNWAAEEEEEEHLVAPVETCGSNKMYRHIQLDWSSETIRIPNTRYWFNSKLQDLKLKLYKEKTFTSYLTSLAVFSAIKQAFFGCCCAFCVPGRPVATPLETCANCGHHCVRTRSHLLTVVLASVSSERLTNDKSRSKVERKEVDLEIEWIDFKTWHWSHFASCVQWAH